MLQVSIIKSTLQQIKVAQRTIIHAYFVKRVLSYLIRNHNFKILEKVIENPQVNIISTKDISEVDKPKKRIRS